VKVLAIISARAGSKGTPRKNLRPLGDQPLIAWSIRAALAARQIDRLILTTEDDEIADIGRKLGIEVPFRRPDELASDKATGIMVAQHSLHAMDALGFRADIHVHLFPTCPFLPAEKIDEAIELVKSGYDSAIGVQDAGHGHPYRTLVFHDGAGVKPFLDTPLAQKPVNRQDLPPVFLRCGAPYVRRRELLDRWTGGDYALGQRWSGVKLSDVEAINIDRPIDFDFAEFLVEKRVVRPGGNAAAGAA
jgi:CMP-N,N'-diacetyllegionaminic acid synthase